MRRGLHWLARFWADYFIPGHRNTPRSPTNVDGPAPYLELVVTVYAKGQDAAGRMIFDIQHDAISFRDKRAEDFAFVRHILTLLASALPATTPSVRQPVPLDPEPISLEVA